MHSHKCIVIIFSQPFLFSYPYHSCQHRPSCYRLLAQSPDHRYCQCYRFLPQVLKPETVCRVHRYCYLARFDYNINVSSFQSQCVRDMPVLRHRRTCVSRLYRLNSRRDSLRNFDHLRLSIVYTVFSYSQITTKVRMARVIHSKTFLGQHEPFSMKYPISRGHR